MTVMFLEARQGVNQSASLVLYTVSSLQSSQVFGSQEKLFASMRELFPSGKVNFKVYNPDKRDKYGVKPTQLCDSSIGY